MSKPGILYRLSSRHSRRLEWTKEVFNSTRMLSHVGSSFVESIPVSPLCDMGVNRGELSHLSSYYEQLKRKTDDYGRVEAI